MRVHVFCVDLPPLPGNPVSGGGVRNGQLIEMLRARGHQVSYSAVANDLNQAGHAVARHDGRLDSQLGQIYLNRAEAVVYGYPIHCALDAATKARLGLKVFFDVHGPTFIEEALWQGGRQLDCFAKFAAALALADEITVVDAAQTGMISTALACAGVRALPPIHILPLAMGLEPLVRDLDDEPLLLAAGGLFPWQRPLRAISAIVATIGQCGRGRFVLAGGPHACDPNRQALLGTFAKLEKQEPRFRYLGFIPREQLRALYARTWAMVELFECNIERQMAITTRTWEHLSLGLPVLYNDYSPLSQLIAANRAGWTVDPADDAAVVSTVAEILRDPGEALARGRNAAAAAARVEAEAAARFAPKLF